MARSSTVTSEMGELKERLSGLLSGCAKETCVRDESEGKVLLAGIETRFRDEHTALVEVFNEQKVMTKAPASLLEALCGEVKAVNED